MRRPLVEALLLGAALLFGSVAASAQTGAEGRAGPIPFRKDSSVEFDSGRWAFGVLAALAVGLGGLWLLRRRLPGVFPGALPLGRERRLKLIESLRVSPRTTLLLVEVDGRAVLLADHAEGVVLLTAPLPSSSLSPLEPRHGDE